MLPLRGNFFHLEQTPFQNGFDLRYSTKEVTKMSPFAGMAESALSPLNQSLFNSVFSSNNRR